MYHFIFVQYRPLSPPLTPPSSLLSSLLLRLVGSSPAGSSCGGAASVQRAEGGQHRGGPGSPATPLPLLRPHVLIVEAAQPQPQQPGRHRTRTLKETSNSTLMNMNSSCGASAVEKENIQSYDSTKNTQRL